MLAIRNGWESMIAYGRSSCSSASATFRIGADINLYVNVLLARLFDNDGFSAQHATLQLIEQIKTINPDVIHLHNLHGYYSNIELLFNYIADRGIPIVWTLHDCWPITGHCTYFDHVQCNRWKTACYACPQKKEYPASLFYDNSKQNYLKKRQLFTGLKNMHLITPSVWLADVVRQSFLAKYPVQVINNGVDLKIFRPRTSSGIREKYHLGTKKIILGVASIWDKRKGLSYFEGLNKLLSENEKIVLVGLTEKQLKQLPPGILGMGRTESSDELASLYSDADVFVNPSSEETFGLTTAEAMACGTPVVVLNATASPELVSPKTGLIVPKEVVPRLKEAVMEILLNGKNAYKAECIARARMLYDSTERYQDYLSVYRKCVDAGHLRRDLIVRS